MPNPTDPTGDQLRQQAAKATYRWARLESASAWLQLIAIGLPLLVGVLIVLGIVAVVVFD